ncbi:hypothetical protein KCU73_g8511, partial [Aureobasidium melanogenum]
MTKFSYNVTRDYPYKWFTPVAIIGGIVLTALFSAINFFSTAYTMVSVTTNQPHEIEAGLYGGPFAHLFASKLQPKCDDASLAVGSTLRTNQSLFEYQLLSVITAAAPALTYHDEVIDSCSVKSVTLDLSTWYDRPADQINASAWGLAVTIKLDCYISRPDNTTAIFDLQTKIDPIKNALIGRFRSKTSKPTAWIEPFAGHASKWAQVLMLVFLEETITAMINQTTTPTNSATPVAQHNLSHGYIQLERSPQPSEIMQDDNYFSKASWVFFDAANNERYMGTNGANNADDATYLVESYVHSSAWPHIWSPVDRLAKAALSAVYIDLGQYPTSIDSMVSDANTLRYWSANLSTIAEQSSIYLGISFFVNKDVTITDYDTQQQLPIDNILQLGALPDPAGNATSRAKISTTYMCRQPQLKPPFNIFISILVADLVFLRTAWSLYNFMVAYFLKSRHPDANICNECLARKKEDDVEVVEEKEDPVHYNKSHGVDEHTIELDYLGPPSPPTRRDDQGSAQSLLIHRHV